jgi:sterol desaturase/sphingolipid hydroxylase (fatty acid hydroxylase superfamily)
VVPTPWVLGVATCLGLGQAAALTLLVVFGWNLLTHSHFRWDDALRRHPLTRRAMAVFENVIVTPGIHHTHHGYGRDGKSFRNYAVMFSFIDRLFGTLHVPEGRPAHYGLPGPNAHWAEETFFPLYRSRPGATVAAGTESR